MGGLNDMTLQMGPHHTNRRGRRADLRFVIQGDTMNNFYGNYGFGFGGCNPFFAGSCGSGNSCFDNSFCGWNTPGYNNSFYGWNTPAYNNFYGWNTPGYDNSFCGWNTPSYSNSYYGWNTPSYNNSFYGWNSPFQGFAWNSPFCSSFGYNGWNNPNYFNGYNNAFAGWNAPSFNGNTENVNGESCNSNYGSTPFGGWGMSYPGFPANQGHGDFANNGTPFNGMGAAKSDAA